MTIFQSAAKKLTAWYVGALCIVCLIFSVSLYAVAMTRLERGARKQADIVQGINGGTYITEVLPRVEILRQQQIRQDRQQLIQSIVIADIIILAIGTYWSYWFARRTMKPIEEAHDAQARFTTDASHELRTPLATMQAEIEVALRGKSFSTSQARDVLHSNLEEIARLRGLSEQLLNLARLDNGPIKTKQLNLTKLLTEHIDSLAKKQSLDLIKDIQPKLRMQGDDQLLRELLNILADNAIKYAGDKPPRLEFQAKEVDGSIQLAMTDYGIGIKASEIPHIFDRLYRGSNASRAGATGHGLGLAIAQQIVEAHDGTIRADSELGKGTTFTITLPVSA